MERFKKMFIAVTLTLVLSLIFTSVVPFTVNYEPVDAASIKMNKTNLTLKVGEKYTLAIKGSKKAYIWSSSNSSVVKVKRKSKAKYKAKITAVSPGTATISAKYNGIYYNCKVTVVADNPITIITPTATPKPTLTPTPTSTPKPTLTPTPTPIPTYVDSYDPYDLLYDDGSYAPFYLTSFYTGNEYNSEPGYIVGCVRDYNLSGTNYTETTYKDKDYQSLDFYFLPSYDPSNSDNYLSIKILGLKGGESCKLSDITGSVYDARVAVTNQNWFISNRYVSTKVSSDIPKFKDINIECYYNTDKASAIYFYISIIDDSGALHEIEGLRVMVADQSSIVSPTTTPTPAPTPKPTPIPTPTPAPTATPTPSPTSTVNQDKIKVTCEYCGGIGLGICLTCGGRGGHDCNRCHGRGEELCTLCDGYGRIGGLYGYSTCSACDGFGYLKCTAYGCWGSGFVDCLDCGGDGITTCPYCGGWGEYYTSDFTGTITPTSTPVEDPTPTPRPIKPQIPGTLLCAYCGGTGFSNCSTCLGIGKFKCYLCKDTPQKDCTKCHGTGYYNCIYCSGEGGSRCTHCGGNGWH